jgi:hypothetical protein
MGGHGPLMVASGPATDISKDIYRGGHPRWPFLQEWPEVARMTSRVDPAAAIAEEVEPCGWMPFSGLPDGPFRWG